jgi:hypothetical protein
MKNVATISLAAAMLLAAAPARAGDDSGLTIGLRAVYGVPFGDAGDGTRLNELTKGVSPLQLDVGYRLDSRWQVGGYFGYGFVRVADQAKSAVAAQGATDIDGHALMRVGVQGIYTLPSAAGFKPWLGLTAGYEWLRYASGQISGKETEVGLRGFEAGVQVGADYRVGSAFSVGPFAAFNVGQFRSRITWTSGSGETSDFESDGRCGLSRYQIGAALSRFCAEEVFQPGFACERSA